MYAQRHTFTYVATDSTTASHVYVSAPIIAVVWLRARIFDQVCSSSPIQRGAGVGGYLRVLFESEAMGEAMTIDESFQSPKGTKWIYRSLGKGHAILLSHTGEGDFMEKWRTSVVLAEQHRGLTHGGTGPCSFSSQPNWTGPFILPREHEWLIFNDSMCQFFVVSSVYNTINNHWKKYTGNVTARH